MFVNVSADNAYWFQSEQIRIIEEKYQAQYMGHWCIRKDQNSPWSDNPVDVFYVANPDTSKGHSHYFGMFVRDGVLLITNAETAFEDEMTGVLLSTGEVMVSRYRHDCQIQEGQMVDGGRDYLKTNVNAKLVSVRVQADKFMFAPVLNLA